MGLCILYASTEGDAGEVLFFARLFARGADRSFASPALTPGKTYTYEVKARWMEDGQPVEQTRRVKVEANRTSTVEFGQPATNR